MALTLIEATVSPDSGIAREDYPNFTPAYDINFIVTVACPNVQQ